MLPHFFIILSVSSKSNINFTIKMLFLSHGQNLKLFSKKILKILRYLLITSEINSEKTLNIN